MTLMFDRAQLASRLRALLSGPPCACLAPTETWCPRHGQHLCRSCGHEIGRWHRDEGCWHAVAEVRDGGKAGCPCAVPWNQARELVTVPPLDVAARLAHPLAGLAEAVLAHQDAPHASTIARLSRAVNQLTATVANIDQV